MKLLIFTQKVDSQDPVLGFFHRWIQEFSKKFESIIVICLYKGENSLPLPSNVKVLSLGKERGVSKLGYVFNFYKYIFSEWKNYDRVFVHMNQEYVLLGGKFWRIFGKKVYMWRNHHAGNFLTDLAVFYCNKVFCPSKFSYTAKFKKAVLMPVGVDVENFKSVQGINRLQNSVLSLGRIAPVKRTDLFVDAVNKVHENHPRLIASIYGDALPADREYLENLKKNSEDYIQFYPGIPNKETVSVYSAHNIFINLSSSGMYDKTIFEAMACGCLILASNENLRGNINDDFIFRQGDLDDLTTKLEKLLKYTDEERKNAIQELQAFAEKHSLQKLADKLFIEIQ